MKKLIIYYALKTYNGNKIVYLNIPYDLKGSLFMWRAWIKDWNMWSFSEKKTQKICDKLNKQ